MFAQYQIKNKILKSIIIISFLIITIPLISILLEVIKTYGQITGSIARYVITTNQLP